MKASKTMVLVAVVLMIAGAVACGGGGKYGSAKALMGKQVAAMSHYADAMEKAGNAREVAAALNAYAAEQKALIPAMMDLQKKYPELMAQKEAPVELKAEMEKMKEISMRLVTVSMKAAQYMQDPIVQEAQKNLAEAMTSMK
jgi:CO dehydrogenase/acetyl-CoA synthase gamma subunit (corrinoid Fe-S protein)